LTAIKSGNGLYYIINNPGGNGDEEEFKIPFYGDFYFFIANILHPSMASRGIRLILAFADPSCKK